MACLQLVYLYVTQTCLHTLMQPRLPANQSTRTILVIREFKIYDAAVAKTSLKIASSRVSIFFVTISVYVTFKI